MTSLMGEMEDEIPVIKFGDASVAAPFTSKVSSVTSGIIYHSKQNSCQYCASRSIYSSSHDSNVQDSCT